MTTREHDEQQERRVRRSEIATRLAIVLAVIYALGTTGTIVVLAVQDNHRISQNTEIQQFIKDQAITNGEISKQVRDCTTPEGECYQRSREATADAVGNINQVVILAAACASGLPQGLPVDERQARIQSCVIDRLALSKAKP